jgi:hypothetical protein
MKHVLALSITCGTPFELDSRGDEQQIGTTYFRGGLMKMRFTLNMENLDVNGKMIDLMTLDWVEDVSHDKVLEMSHQWISSQSFLTDRMTGLHRVGESSLTIEPVAE